MTAQIPEEEVRAACASLETLSDDELKALIDDDDAFTDFFNQLPQLKKWESEKESELAKNKTQAEYNLSLEPKLKEGKANLWELYEQARSLVDEVETKRAQLDSLNSRTSLDTTYALLQAASAEAEEKSEELAESFLKGSTDLESFTSQFIQLRVTAHMRRLKTEKIGEIVNSSRQRSYSVPYPTVPQMMPLPPMLPQ